MASGNILAKSKIVVRMLFRFRMIELVKKKRSLEVLVGIRSKEDAEKGIDLIILVIWKKKTLKRKISEKTSKKLNKN